MPIFRTVLMNDVSIIRTLLSLGSIAKVRRNPPVGIRLANALDVIAKCKGGVVVRNLRLILHP